MAQYLTYISSSKESAGSMPDENYARELMQVFTIGLHRLNQDGQVRLLDGAPAPTYKQSDVSGLARVFTGLRLSSYNFSTPDMHAKPLVVDSTRNETGTSYFLGRQVSGGGMRAVSAALDIIFQHENTAPFFARSLIRRLVTSNPSASYISRVAAKFVNDGNGRRGDMKAVIRAVLTDPEARSDAALTAPHTGKVRDPVLRFTAWARAFNLNSTTGSWDIGDLSSPFEALGQSPGRAPSVFHFFRPGYSPPQSELSERGLVAPELQIADEQSIISYLNFMKPRIGSGFELRKIYPNYSWILPLANNAEALVNEINLVLAAGQLRKEHVQLIVQVMNSISAINNDRRMRRVHVAIFLTMASSDFIVLN
jgi:uncharacterized protein (DUF1800 family)